MGPPSKYMEDSGAEGDLNCGSLAHEVSEENEEDKDSQKLGEWPFILARNLPLL